MTPEKRVIQSNDARALLNNGIFKSALARMDEHLEAQAITCDPDNKEKAQRVIIAKQLMKGIIREIESLISDGEIAKVQLSELEQKKKFAVFRR